MKVNLTAVTAIVGAVLGVWNFVQGLWQRRVRLKVVPKLTVIRGSAFVSTDRDVLADGFMTVEVTNMSAFPVTIAEVGFSLVGESPRAVVLPNPPDVLPKRLEPRESINVRTTAGFPEKAKLAYATTQCKHICYGDSIVLKKHRKMIVHFGTMN